MHQYYTYRNTHIWASSRADLTSGTVVSGYIPLFPFPFPLRVSYSYQVNMGTRILSSSCSCFSVPDLGALIPGNSPTYKFLQVDFFCAGFLKRANLSF